MQNEQYYFDADNLVFYPKSLKNSYKNVDFSKMTLVAQDVFNAMINSDQQLSADSEGKPFLLPLPPSAYHKWNGKKWTLPAAAKQQQLADAKSEKLAELNQFASTTLEAIANTSNVPAFERATWELQRIEAQAWHADNSTPTPCLDRIAQMRGIPPKILKKKAYKKATQFQTLTSTFAGLRQKYADMIDIAQTLSDVNAIEFDFTMLM